MKLFFESYPYNIEIIQKYLSSHFYYEDVKGKSAYIPYVGYYYDFRENSPETADSIFILPKVFLQNGKNPFGLDIKPEELINLETSTLPTSIQSVIFDLSSWLYSAIAKFYRRNLNTTITESAKIQDVVSNIGSSSTTYLDIILSLFQFYKDKKFLFTKISAINSSGNNNIHWGKTIAKTTPYLKNKIPIYTNFKTRTKSINYDEEILVLFFSILNYLAPQFRKQFKCDVNYNLLTVSKIKSIIEAGKGTRILKKIKHKYFTDDLVALWRLLYTFFEKSENIVNKKYHEEILLVRDFNIVFEDMIDHLIGEDPNVPKKLKDQVDGKKVDHIYGDKSLIDGNLSNIYFIGDSKYYKDGNLIKGEALDKQFTYAKNVIQFNINLLLDNDEDDSHLKFRYRDKTTEGYNITPNFFIRGVVDNENQEYSNSSPNLLNVSVDSDPINKHYKDRLFDRDTLIVQTYDINFLYVLHTYILNVDSRERNEIRNRFRKDLIDTFNSRYIFYKVYPKGENLELAMENFVDKFFRKLIGKIFRPSQSSEYIWLAFEKSSKDKVNFIKEIEDFGAMVKEEKIPYQIGK